MNQHRNPGIKKILFLPASSAAIRVSLNSLHHNLFKSRNSYNLNAMECHSIIKCVFLMLDAFSTAISIMFLKYSTKRLVYSDTYSLWLLIAKC